MATLSEHPGAKIGAGGAREPMPIELDGLSHNYGDRLALDNLSFAVQPAEIFGLLGPNGSGKTTLFRILSTLIVPTGGSARIEGFDVAGIELQRDRSPSAIGNQLAHLFGFVPVGMISEDRINPMFGQAKNRAAA